jgi:hypothetical protein
VDGARDWLMQMGEGAAKAGVTIQYCGAKLQHLLQSTEVEAVRQARVSEDYTPNGSSNGSPNGSSNRTNQWSIGTSSIIAEALGLAPFKDVFWSSSETVPDAMSR